MSKTRPEIEQNSLQSQTPPSTIKPKFSKAAEGLMPIKIEIRTFPIGQDLLSPAPTSDCLKTSELNSTSTSTGRSPNEEIMPWEFQEFNLEAVPTQIAKQNASASQSYAQTPTTAKSSAKTLSPPSIATRLMTIDPKSPTASSPFKGFFGKSAESSNGGELSPQEEVFRARNLSTGRSTSLSESIRRSPSYLKSNTKESSILSRCIRVYDMNETCHAIEVSAILSDAKAIRDKIFVKIGSNIGATPEMEYELYARAQAFNSNRFIRDTSIDDLTLVEICSNPDHPYRAQLVFDKKRHPRIVTGDAGVLKEIGRERRRKAKKGSMDDIDIEDKKKDSSKLEDFFGENINEVPSRQQRRRRHKLKKGTVGSLGSIEMLDMNPQELDDAVGGRGEKISKLVDFFGENVATAANSKLADFFGSDEKGAGHSKKPLKKKKEEEVKDVDITDDLAQKPKTGSKKLEAFFGDRPPQEMIAKNLEVFFPGLNALKTSERQDAPSKFQDAVYESIQTKRNSSMLSHQLQNKQILERKRNFSSRLQLDLGASITEGLESIFDLGESSGNLRDNTKNVASSKRRPLGMNMGRESGFIFASIDALTEDSLKKSTSANVLAVLEEAEQQVILTGSTLSREVLTGFVEEMLNLPPQPSTLRAVESNSTAEFLHAFSVDPDKPTQIKWIQGPMIGIGSFGKVFYGANCETGEIMAVKQVAIRNHSIDSKTRQKMLTALHTEIGLLKDLDHHNIVRYLGYCTEKDVINVFLEYVSGGSVTSALALMGRFDEILVKSLITQVLHGIEYLHGRHIIHRDIKGGNILIDDDGMAKISDFGHDLAYQNNSIMSVQGTVYWMGKGYSAKVDIWSLGCVILEMLTCKHPWQGLDEIQTLWRLGRFDRPPMPSDLSKKAMNFLEKTFAIDPNDRPTACSLLDHEFCIYNVDELDFRSYKEAAIRKKQKEMEAEDEDDDSEFDDESDYDEDEDDEMTDE